MTEKTYKREIAAAMLVFLAGLLIWGVWEPEAANAAQGVMGYIFAFAGAMFGMDAYAKQVR